MKYKKLFMLGLILQSYAYGSSGIPQGVVVADQPNGTYIRMGYGNSIPVMNNLKAPVYNHNALTLNHPLETVTVKTTDGGGAYLNYIFDRGILNKIPANVIQDGLYVSLNISEVSSWVGFVDTQETTPARKLVANLTDKAGNIYAEAIFYAAKNVSGYSGYAGQSSLQGQYYWDVNSMNVVFTDSQGNNADTGLYQINSKQRAWLKSSNGVAALAAQTLPGTTLAQLWFSPVFSTSNVGPYAELEISLSGNSSNLQKINTALASGSGPVRITATYDTINKTYYMTGTQNGSQVFSQQGPLGKTYKRTGNNTVAAAVPYNAPLANFNITIQTSSSSKKVFNYSSIDGVELTSSGGNLIIQGVCNKVSGPSSGTFAAGETLSDVEIGFTFTGSGKGKSGDTMVQFPLTAAHLAFINPNLAAGKEVSLDVSLNKGAAFYGMHATLSVPGDSSVTPMTISQQPLVGTGSLSGGVSSTTYTIKDKGTSIGYKTNNSKGMTLVSKNQMSFKQRSNAVLLQGQSGGGSSTTLVGQLQALGHNPSQSTVESTIKTYYHNNMTTIKNDWSTVSSGLSTAGLSSMTSGLKAIFDPAPPANTGGKGGGGGSGASGRF